MVSHFTNKTPLITARCCNRKSPVATHGCATATATAEDVDYRPVSLFFTFFPSINVLSLSFLALHLLRKEKKKKKKRSKHIFAAEKKNLHNRFSKTEPRQKNLRPFIKVGFCRRRRSKELRSFQLQFFSRDIKYYY